MKLKSRQPDLLLREAQSLHREGRLEQAWEYYRDVLDVQPDVRHSRHAFAACEGLATLALRLGKYEDALGYVKKLLSVKPHAMIYHSHHGAALLGLRRYDKAIEAYKLAIRLTKNAVNHDNLAGAYREKKDYAKAIEHHQMALALNPTIAHIYNNYATTCMRSERLSEALDILAELLKRHPDHAPGWHNLGYCLRCLGHADLALRASQKALLIDPEYQPARFNAALCQLLMGDMANGWTSYESRARIMAGEKASGLDPAKTWQGESLDPSETLLLQAEQGLGDTLQFARYGESARKMAGQVILRVQPDLIPILAHSFAERYIYASTEAPPPAHSRHCMLLSAPRWLPPYAPARQTFPYLKVPESAKSKWRGIVSNWQDRFRVGLVWKGNPNHINDGARSLAFHEALSVVTELPDSLKKKIAVFSLQKGAPSSPALKNFSIPDLGDELSGFIDTAAALQEIDLLITVDTAIAHLAGALGRPCWMYVSHAVDWRWGLDGESTPWYPSLRIFREPGPGARAQALSAMREALAKAALTGDGLIPSSPARDFVRLARSPYAPPLPQNILRLLAEDKNRAPV